MIFLFYFYLRSREAGAFGRTRSENSALSYRRGFSPSYKNITCVNFHRHFRKLTIQNAIFSENFFIFTENSPTGITIVVWKNFVYPKLGEILLIKISCAIFSKKDLSALLNRQNSNWSFSYERKKFSIFSAIKDIEKIIDAIARK